MSDEGHGIAIAFDSGFFGAITSVRLSGVSRNAIDTTTYATTGAMTNAPAALYNPGTVEVEGHFDPTDLPAVVNGSAAENCDITWTDSGASVWRASGWMSNFSVDGSDAESRVMFSATVQLSGAITLNPV